MRPEDAKYLLTIALSFELAVRAEEPTEAQRADNERFGVRFVQLSDGMLRDIAAHLKEIAYANLTH